jgi:endothelin-converting enzyme/putative endopeptidase
VPAIALRDRGAVAPGDDFFTHANAAWLDTVTFPPGSPIVGSFEEVRLRTRARLDTLLREAVAAAPTAPSGDPRRLIGALYASAVDTARLEALGLAPVRADFARILALDTHADVARWMADPGSSALVSAAIAPDAERPNLWLVHLANADGPQPVLGLPGRGDYLEQDAPAQARRAAYRAYVAATLARAGVDRADQRAADVVALETAVAARMWDPARLRDQRANYHPMSRAALAAFAPGFPWDALLEARGVGGAREVVLGTDSAAQANARLFAETPVDAWRSYLAFHWLQNHVEALPAAFQRASHAFYRQRLAGVTTPWQWDPARGTTFIDRYLGEPLGRLYVARYFPPEARAQVAAMVGHLRAAFADRLARADWMDDATRAAAQAKLAALTVKVGYPDRWRDLSGAALDPADLYGNVRRLRAAEWAEERAALDRPRPRGTIWYQTPQTVDATNSQRLVAVEFPAGILQPPFFDPAADAAANYGAIGAVIGHELGHAFDDQGSRFDREGLLRDWWTPATRARYDARAAALAAQYDTYEPLPGVRVNGRQTLGESVADLTGVSLAHDAYRRSLSAQGPRANAGARAAGDSTAADRAFFLAYARVWRVRLTDEVLRDILRNSYYAPGMLRVNGTVRNLDAWHAAFGVTPAQRLYLPPERRVTIW